MLSHEQREKITSSDKKYFINIFLHTLIKETSMATNMKSRKDYISKRKRYLGESQELGKDSGTKII